MSYYSLGGKHPRLIDISDYTTIAPLDTTVPAKGDATIKIEYSISFNKIMRVPVSSGGVMDQLMFVTNGVYETKKERDEEYKRIEELWLKIN